jgi:hypothetical protein
LANVFLDENSMFKHMIITGISWLMMKQAATFGTTTTSTNEWGEAGPNTYFCQNPADHFVHAAAGSENNSSTAHKIAPLAVRERPWPWALQL